MSDATPLTHSPLPWRVFERKQPIKYAVDAFVLDAVGENVLFRAEIGLPKHEFARPKINAAFIVRAVNNHAALIAALRNRLHYDACACAACEPMQAAIKKAEA